MNRKTVIGIAAGAAALAGAAWYISKKRTQEKGEHSLDEAKENFKGKLNELQRKASKELKNAGNDTKEAVNAAKDRANDWVNNTAQA